MPYKCRACKRQFSSTTETIFEASHVPVSKWLLAIHLLSAVECKRRLRMFPVERVDGCTLQEAIRSRVHLSAHMMTDDLKSYHGFDMGFAGHGTIKHSAGKYVDDNIHTNTVEGAFSLLKQRLRRNASARETLLCLRLQSILRPSRYY